MLSKSIEVIAVGPSYTDGKTARIEHQSRVETTHGALVLGGEIDLDSPNGETLEEVMEDHGIANAMIEAWIRSFEESL